MAHLRVRTGSFPLLSAQVSAFFSPADYFMCYFHLPLALTTKWDTITPISGMGGKVIFFLNILRSIPRENIQEIEKVT